MKSLEFFKPTLATTLAIVLAWLLSVRPAQAGYIVTLQQVGPDVVATGSGPIDLTGLSFFITQSGGAAMEPQLGNIFTGQHALSESIYLGISGPTSFGSGGVAIPNSASGDQVGIAGNAGFLLVPTGYVSGNALSDMATYSGKTFATLGVTPGTYVWKWGTGADQNFTLQIIGPATMPDSGSTVGLLFLSLAALLGASRFRSQQSA